MIDDFNAKEKLRTVREVLKELEGIIEDGLTDGDPVDVPAITLIETALEMYKEYIEGAKDDEQTSS